MVNTSIVVEDVAISTVAELFCAQEKLFPATVKYPEADTHDSGQALEIETTTFAVESPFFIHLGEIVKFGVGAEGEQGRF